MREFSGLKSNLHELERRMKKGFSQAGEHTGEGRLRNGDYG